MLFPKDFRVCIPLMVSVMYVPCGGAQVQSSRAVASMSFQRHVDPRKEGAISGVVCLFRAGSAPQLQTLCPCPMTAPFSRRRSWVACGGSFSRKEVVPLGH